MVVDLLTNLIKSFTGQIKYFVNIILFIVKKKELVFVNEYNEGQGRRKVKRKGGRKKRGEEELGGKRESESQSNNVAFQLNCLSEYKLEEKVFNEGCTCARKSLIESYMKHFMYSCYFFTDKLSQLVRLYIG